MDKVNEESTALLRTILYDENGDELKGSAVAAFTVTLFDKDSATAINSRTDVDLYDGGSWTSDSGMKATLDESGNCTIRLASDDNQIVGSNPSDGEVHVILIKITTTGALPVQLNDEIEFIVKNLTKVT